MLLAQGVLIVGQESITYHNGRMFKVRGHGMQLGWERLGVPPRHRVGVCARLWLDALASALRGRGEVCCAEADTSLRCGVLVACCTADGPHG